MNLSPEFQAALKQLLVQHEGYKNYPYPDTEGNITIGIGYNLTARGISDEWINQQYESDIQYFNDKLTEDYPWYDWLTDERKMVLIDMCFMGYKKFQTFQKMLKALSVSDFKTAASEMLDSKWASEVKTRALMLASIMMKGEI